MEWQFVFLLDDRIYSQKVKKNTGRNGRSNLLLGLFRI